MSLPLRYFASVSRDVRSSTGTGGFRCAALISLSSVWASIFTTMPNSGSIKDSIVASCQNVCGSLVFSQMSSSSSRVGFCAHLACWLAARVPPSATFFSRSSISRIFFLSFMISRSRFVGGPLAPSTWTPAGAGAGAGRSPRRRSQWPAHEAGARDHEAQEEDPRDRGPREEGGGRRDPRRQPAGQVRAEAHPAGGAGHLGEDQGAAHILARGHDRILDGAAVRHRREDRRPHRAQGDERGAPEPPGARRRPDVPRDRREVPQGQRHQGQVHAVRPGHGDDGGGGGRGLRREPGDLGGPGGAQEEGRAADGGPLEGRLLRQPVRGQGLLDQGLLHLRACAGPRGEGVARRHEGGSRLEGPEQRRAEGEARRRGQGHGRLPPAEVGRAPGPRDRQHDHAGESDCDSGRVKTIARPSA
mmetsp:Transcript_72714/g.190614  ORF Transcript_72714/g.190614 Transcript_72714/m.190614 type:complete len:416 (-) Transcript_72714:285-1532(-)